MSTTRVRYVDGGVFSSSNCDSNEVTDVSAITSKDDFSLDYTSLPSFKEYAGLSDICGAKFRLAVEN
jgi:hypothetical protein